MCSSSATSSVVSGFVEPAHLKPPARSSPAAKAFLRARRRNRTGNLLITNRSSADEAGSGSPKYPQLGAVCVVLTQIKLLLPVLLPAICYSLRYSLTALRTARIPICARPISVAFRGRRIDQIRGASPATCIDSDRG